MKKTLESYVFADNEEMIANLMTMQDMLEIFFFKDYIDQQTFFVFKLSSYLCSFMDGPRTF